MPPKRLLVLTPRFPYPEIAGDSIRILQICRALAGQFQMTLLSLCDSRDQLEFQPRDGIFSGIERVYLPRWRSYLNTAMAIPSSRPLQLAYYKSPKFRDRLGTLLPKHDFALAHLIRTGQYLEYLNVPKILEMTDAISMNYLQMRRLHGNRNWKRAVYALEQQRLMAYERRTVRRFDRVWLTSETDRAFLDPSRELAINVIPNGVDAAKLPFQPPSQNANAIVFIGNMRSVQNQDACHYFIRHILPAVRAEADVVFRIVGSASERVQKQFRKYTNVEMTGRIERIQDGVGNAFCGVCPVRAAAGIQNKILEYLALGLPCITSELALEGIEATAGLHLLAYKSDQEAASQVLMLLRDLDLRLKLASSGRDFVVEKYDWRRLYDVFAESASGLCHES